MKPVVVENAVGLDGPPELVWRLLTDWERQGDWMLEASDFEVITPHREGVGVEALATVSIGGISTRDRIRVDVWDPPRHLGIVHLGWVGGRGDLQLTPLDGGRTRLDWREELRPPWGALGALGLRIFTPLLVRTFRRDARLLGDLVRAAADGRYPGTQS
jgi:carbon monoxide dehydrogenase subunit G